ncbi:hypothetical protein ABZ128_17545 [Streptomyces sp. NPDC006326]|uniref:hypothetical protein n=1 Tax=Streptomyces sp. NPDC006326 TaxID=3156752 RepID=UPI00339F687A
MSPSIVPAREIGLAILLVAALVGVVGLRHLLRHRRFERAEPGARERLTFIPAQRGAAAHPMESVELTEAEEQAFAGLVRSLPLH